MFKQQNAETTGNLISRLWIFSFFTMVYRDIHEMAVADTIEGILAGTYEGNPVTDAGLVAGGVVLILLLATYVLTPILKPHLARRLNLLMPPITIVGVLYLIPNDPDDFVLAAGTVVAVVTIFLISFFFALSVSAGSKKSLSFLAGRHLFLSSSLFFFLPLRCLVNPFH